VLLEGTPDRPDAQRRSAPRPGQRSCGPGHAPISRTPQIPPVSYIATPQNAKTFPPEAGAARP